MGMKLEAIREDRTRGGRSTYQCSYTIPPGLGGGQRSGSEVTEVPQLLVEIMNVVDYSPDYSCSQSILQGCICNCSPSSSNCRDQMC